MSKYNITVSGNNVAPVDGAGADTVSVDELDTDMTEDMESLTLSEDTLSYIAATNTCIAFGVFLLVGLILAKMAWGRFN